jgi:DNA-binding HxlR family transcriptional regulator
MPMHRKSLGNEPCPIARSLERVGEWWNILILREAFYGATRFDEFEQRLGIAPSMLTRRLNALVDDGLLERRLYSHKPPRAEYLLTERGHDFRPVLLALMNWGNKHFAADGLRVVLVDRQTGAPVTPALVDPANGRPITETDHILAAGPAASERLRARVANAATVARAALPISQPPNNPPNAGAI